MFVNISSYMCTYITYYIMYIKYVLNVTHTFLPSEMVKHIYIKCVINICNKNLCGVNMYLNT